MCGQPDWLVGFAIETSGKLPKHDHRGYATRFELMVSRDLWSVTVYRRGKQFDFIWRPRGRAYIGNHTLTLASPTELATIGRWLTRVERKLGTEFRRDRPAIHSNLKGAAKAIARWCALEMIDIRRMPEEGTARR